MIYPKFRGIFSYFKEGKNWGKLFISLVFVYLFFTFIRPTNLPWWSNYFQILALAFLGGWLLTSLFDFSIKDSKKIRLALVLLFLIGFFIYLNLQLGLYYTLGSPMRDVSIFDQAIWHLSQFELPASSVRSISNLWGDHLNPIIALIAPLYWLKSDVRWLFILQALIASLGAFPIYGIAKEKLKSDFAGIAMAFAFLFFIGIQHAVNFGFYPETLSITFLAFMIYFFFKRRYLLYFVFLLLCLLCKENISLYIAFFGIWIFLFEKRRWQGLITFLIGILYFKAALWLIPNLSSEGYIYFRYLDMGSSPLAVIKTIILKPIYTLKILFGADKISGWLGYLTPFAFLPLLSSFLIVLLPVMGEKFLSRDPKLWVMGYHYGANATTFLVIGSILSISGFIESKIIKRIGISKDQIINYFSLVVIILTIAFTVQSGGPLLKLAHSSSWQYQFPLSYREAIELIPSNKSLAAQMTLGTALAHRDELYWWPKAGEDADFIFISSKYATFPLSREEHKEKIRQLLSNKDYSVRYSQGDIILFEKGLENSVPLSSEMRAYLEE